MVAGGLFVVGQATDINRIPLQDISVDTTINHLIATCNIRQRYINTSTTPLECRYVFPLDAQSSVYHFTAEFNGQRIIAKCQEKKQAREQYDVYIPSHSPYFVIAL
jgi:hypothetical protein